MPPTPEYFNTIHPNQTLLSRACNSPPLFVKNKCAWVIGASVFFFVLRGARSWMIRAMKKQAQNGTNTDAPHFTHCRARRYIYTEGLLAAALALVLGSGGVVLLYRVIKSAVGCLGFVWARFSYGGRCSPTQRNRCQTRWERLGSVPACLRKKSWHDSLEIFLAGRIEIVLTVL